MNQSSAQTADDPRGQDRRPHRLPQYVLPRGPVGWIVGKTIPLFHGPIHREAARVLNLRPDDEVLDVACGNGRFLKKYAGHVRSVAGLDASPVMVKAARKAHRRRLPEGTAAFVLGDASELPWPDGRLSVACDCGARATSSPRRTTRASPTRASTTPACPACRG